MSLAVESEMGAPPPPPRQALTICTALLRSQSAKMMRGDFPPSSRDTFFTLLRAQLKGTEIGTVGLGPWETETWGFQVEGPREAAKHALLKEQAGGQKEFLPTPMLISSP